MKKIIAIFALFAISAGVMAGIDECFEKLWRALLNNNESSFRKVWEKTNNAHRQKIATMRVCWNTNKHTLLHVACKNKMTEIVELLLYYGADVNGECNPSCETPLLLAVDNQYLEIFKTLLNNNANVNAINTNGNSVIHLVCRVEDTSMLKALLDHRPNVDAKDYNGQTALHHVVTKNMVDHTQLLLSAGASANIKNDEGVTPIFLTIYDNVLLNILLHHNSHLDYADSKGYTLLHHAIRNGRIDTMHILLESGANVNVTNASGSTPLHYAASHHMCLRPPNRISREEAISIENSETMQMVNSLIINGADVDIKNNKGKTPLHNASSFSSREVIKLLLNNKADINGVDLNGYTMLHCAILHKNIDGLVFLLDSNLFACYDKDFWGNVVKFTQESSNNDCLNILLPYLKKIDEAISALDDRFNALIGNLSASEKYYVSALIVINQHSLKLKNK
ncbi:MAG: ankyrin repeat domain-containing protein [Candidatus Endonucleobacter bathymodioli]|uniref:Ankyrin repeat domain-containing protein n=1 Tax=Candidatus Endonucleibacter bathymodioli TaxID=539814 RepID=A0AA90NWI4_9GAMM|nr:ankyrin repeat domain-containing protein [Candidatus Endonucleobacter bathymodioli]